MSTDGEPLVVDALDEAALEQLGARLGEALEQGLVTLSGPLGVGRPVSAGDCCGGGDTRARSRAPPIRWWSPIPWREAPFITLTCIGWRTPRSWSTWGCGII